MVSGCMGVAWLTARNGGRLSAVTRSARHLTHGMPPPDRALSAVGGGAGTPAPAPCTAVAGAGAAAVGEDLVAVPVGSVKSVPITTRILPAGSVAWGAVGNPPRDRARLEAAVSPP